MQHKTCSCTLESITNCEQGGDMLMRYQINHEGVCKGCAQGKNTKNPFPSSDSKAKWILNIVHLDICGPMKTTSLSRYVYYASLIND